MRGIVMARQRMNDFVAPSAKIINRTNSKTIDGDRINRMTPPINTIAKSDEPSSNAIHRFDA